MFFFTQCAIYFKIWWGSIFRLTVSLEQQYKVAMPHEQAGVCCVCIDGILACCGADGKPPWVELLHIEELSCGSHAVAPYPSAHFHPVNGGREESFTKPPKKPRKVGHICSKSGHVTGNVQPPHADLTGLQVSDWK